MRGCVAVLFLLILGATSAYPQCNWAPRTTTQFRSSALDVAVDGNDLWVATSYGVQLLDRAADPPSLVATIAVPGVTRVVRPRNGFVYAGSGSRIYVLRRNANKLEIAGSADAGGTVNDLHFADAYLFAATSNGLAHFALFEPLSPQRTTVILSTTTPNVTSLASAGALLYAADGDATVEIYSLASAALPQKTDQLESLPGANAVNLTSNRVYVSDGQRTEVFSGKFKEATLPYGAVSFAPLASEIHFIAGRDRTLRVVDFSLAAKPSGLFEELLPGSGGTVNRISAIQVAGGRAYVAAGDIGLITYDLSSFTSPYPLHTHAGGVATSALVMNRVYATNAMPDGGIVEYELAADGSLNPRRTWAASARHTLLDGNAGLLLTANGSSVLQWDTVPATPTNVTTAEFDFTIRSAVLVHAARGYVLLEDGSLWTVNFAAAGSTKQRTGNATLLARSGNAVATVLVNNDTGDTEFRYAASGDLASITRTATIPGAANGTLALGTSYAAVTTFRGINVVNLATGGVSVLPDSLISVSPQLRIEGNRLLALTSDALVMWDLPSAKRVRDFAVESGTSLHAAGTTAAVATPTGVTTVAYESRSELPRLVAHANPNRYHTKLAVAAGRAYLFSRDGIDIYDTEFGRSPRFVSSLRPAALFDAAAGTGALYTLATNGVVTMHSRDGAPLAQATINEGSDTQMLGIFTAGNAVWVAFSKGCLTGACERKTLVLDSKTLAVNATLAGGAIDVAVSGNRAYALFRLPNEMRVYDLTDSLHPAQLVQAASPANAVSLALHLPLMHVLADKVYSFTAATLNAANEHLSAATTNDNQRIRVEGSCAVVTGRGVNPELYRLPDWTGATPFEVPSNVRSIAVHEGRVYVLTDHSLEVWSEEDGKTTKKRAVR